MNIKLYARVFYLFTLRCTY